jgi:hypothetical protein
MRTHKEFQKELRESHSCEKSKGKIISISIDARGNEFCAYCNAQVNYPRATKEELVSWMEEVKCGET